MKKTMVLLMIVSIVIGMIVPAMATDTDKAKADADAAGTATANAKAINTAGDVSGIANSKPKVTTSADANGGSNQKTIDVDVTGYNSADNKIKQVLENNGDQTNYAKGTAVGGNAQAISWAAPDNDQSTDSSASNHGHTTSGDNTNDCKAANNGDQPATGGNNNSAVLAGSATNIETATSTCTNNGGAAANTQNANSNGNGNNANNAATSNAIAVGGSPKGIDGDVTQVNAIVQVATANIDNDQTLDQTVDIDEAQFANGGTATDDTTVTSDATTNPFSEAFSNPITSDATSDTTADADADA